MKLGEERARTVDRSWIDAIQGAHFGPASSSDYKDYTCGFAKTGVSINFSRGCVPATALEDPKADTAMSYSKYLP